MTASRMTPLNGCMCQEGTCKSCNRLVEAFEAMWEALKGMVDYCDSELNGAPPRLSAKLLAADSALALADKVRQ